MRIRVLAVGTKMPAWVDSAIDEYQKRLPRDWRFEMVELPLGYRAKGQDPQKAKASEGQSLLNAINPPDWVVALDVKGKPWSTEQLSREVGQWQMQGSDVILLIGGPDGLDAPCLTRANQRWSLSALTLPHPLVRVVLVEQLYRSWTLLNNHPYHK